MHSVNIQDAKTHFSALIEAVERGESVIICKRNLPVAELKPVRVKRKPRQLGLWKGRFKVGRALLEPMSDAELAEWEESL